MLSELYKIQQSRFAHLQSNHAVSAVWSLVAELRCSYTPKRKLSILKWDPLSVSQQEAVQQNEIITLEGVTNAHYWQTGGKC